MSDVYAGEKGQAYYDMRSQRRDDFVQERRALHFQEFIQADNTVLDFGCGTGGVLSNLICKEKIGVEVNPPSVEEAKAKGIHVVPSLSDIEDNSIDIVISNHALEHVPNPADQIKDILRVLKPGHKAVLVVPSENPGSWRFNHFNKQDPDQHIFSWTPLSFGNLIAQCGFEIEKSCQRPIGYSKFNKPLADISEPLFQVSRHIVALALGRYEVACVAVKPASSK